MKCKRCKQNPCLCGWEYREFSECQINMMIAAMRNLINFRNTTGGIQDDELFENYLNWIKE